MKRLVAHVMDNWKVISLTFEIFWIGVFVLHAAASTGTQVAQFVYVNF